MRLTDLPSADQAQVQTHAVTYLEVAAIARFNGHAHPESVARQHKLDAYRLLLRLDFTPIEAVEAFRDACAAAEEAAS